MNGKSHGIRDVEDVRQRCHCTPDGCWIWRGATSAGNPCARIDGHSTPVRRWVHLRHHGIASSDRVVVSDCGTPLCVAPEHSRRITLSEASRRKASRAHMRQVLRANGKRRGDQVVTPRETVETIERMLAEGQRHRDIVAVLGVGRLVVRKVANGRHRYSAARSGELLRGASVFAL